MSPVPFGPARLHPSPWRMHPPKLFNHLPASLARFAGTKGAATVGRLHIAFPGGNRLCGAAPAKSVGCCSAANRSSLTDRGMTEQLGQALSDSASRRCICLQPGTVGGFESDSVPFDGSLNSVDGMCNGRRAREDAFFAVFHSGWQEMDLSPLADLPPATRRDLMEKLQEALRDRTTLSYMQSALEESCDYETVQDHIADEEDTVTRISTTMDLMETCRVSRDGPRGDPSLLDLAYLLVCAMEELPDETLNILSNSRHDFLAAFDVLMHRLKASRGTLPIQSLPAPLQDNQAFQQAEQLLRRDAEQLRVEMENTHGVLPMLLGLSAHGLALLCTGLC
ncbi:uncharacterized protein V3H82_010058 [Fundulus diaphanus]